MMFIQFRRNLQIQSNEGSSVCIAHLAWTSMCPVSLHPGNQTLTCSWASDASALGLRESRVHFQSLMRT
jgi:hypothetical protein